MFTPIMINKIDELINNKKYQQAIDISKSYVDSIDKRNTLKIVNEILPKVLEWGRIMHKTDEEIQNHNSDFYDWVFFRTVFLRRIGDLSLNIPLSSNLFFMNIKKYVEELLKKKTNNDYIKSLCFNLSIIIQDKLSDDPAKNRIWTQYFPNEWKITLKNIKSIVPRNILAEFLDWTSRRIYEEKFDAKLNDYIKILFPTVNGELFTSFMQLYYISDIEKFIKSKPPFHILNSTGVFVSYGDEMSDQEAVEKWKKQVEDAKKETIQIILNYFWGYWEPLRFTREDVDEKDTNYDILAKDRQEKIIGEIRQGKIQKLIKEIESDKIKKLCKEKEIYESRRKNLLELMEALKEAV